MEGKGGSARITPCFFEVAADRTSGLIYIVFSCPTDTYVLSIRLLIAFFRRSDSGVWRKTKSGKKIMRGRGRRKNPYPTPSLFFLPTSFCAISAISYTVWTPGTNLFIDKHVHGYNCARCTNHTDIRSWRKTNILATCNDRMFNKELDWFNTARGRKRRSRNHRLNRLLISFVVVVAVFFFSFFLRRNPTKGNL